MSIQTKIDQLIGCGNADAVDFAKKAGELKILVESKLISRSEYDELVTDLKKIQNILERADDLAIKSMINEILNNLESTAGVLL